VTGKRGWEAEVAEEGVVVLGPKVTMSKELPPVSPFEPICDRSRRGGRGGGTPDHKA
jgi:hypothetical protein